MTDRYFASLLVVGGVCTGFALHAAGLAFQTRTRRYVSLMVLALLEAAYCVLVWRYLSLTDSELAKPWGHSFCAFTPFITWAFGELTMDLVERRPRWLTILQKVNLALSTSFAAGVIVDMLVGTSLVVKPEIQTDLTSIHRHLVLFTPLGQAYLAWVSAAFGCFAVLLFGSYRARRDLWPLVVGCILYFAATVSDFGIIFGFRDGLFMQHFGFFALVAGSWLVLANRFREAANRMKDAMTLLKEQRRQLLVTAPILHKQKLDSLGTLVAGVAHEINNPIQSIMNYALLLKREVDLKPPMSGFADEIAGESKRVAEIVQSLLRFGRGDVTPAVPADVSGIIDGTLKLIRSALVHDGIALHVDVDARLPEITCREAQLQQVMMNLIINARDAILRRDPTRTDPKQISIVVSQEVRDGEAWLVLEVSDTGEGIDPALAECIFEPFFTTNGVQGTGLGLWVSRGIVQAHGGTITYESEYGRAARFRVELPYVDRSGGRDGQGRLTPPPAGALTAGASSSGEPLEARGLVRRGVDSAHVHDRTEEESATRKPAEFRSPHCPWGLGF